MNNSTKERVLIERSGVQDTIGIKNETERDMLTTSITESTLVITFTNCSIFIKNVA